MNIFDVWVSLDERQCGATIAQDYHDDEKPWASVVFDCEFEFEHTPEETEWLDGYKRVEPSHTDINIKFGKLNITDGNYTPSSQEIEQIKQAIIQEAWGLEQSEIMEYLCELEY